MELLSLPKALDEIQKLGYIYQKYTSNEYFIYDSRTGNKLDLVDDDYSGLTVLDLGDIDNAICEGLAFDIPVNCGVGERSEIFDKRSPFASGDNWKYLYNDVYINDEDTLSEVLSEMFTILDELS